MKASHEYEEYQRLAKERGQIPISFNRFAEIRWYIKTAITAAVEAERKRIGIAMREIQFDAQWYGDWHRAWSTLSGRLFPTGLPRLDDDEFDTAPAQDGGKTE